MADDLLCALGACVGDCRRKLGGLLLRLLGDFSGERLAVVKAVREMRKCLEPRILLALVILGARGIGALLQATSGSA